MAKGVKTGGRKKGTPNTKTKELSQMILGALDRLGGEDWLLSSAKDDPACFIALVGKMLPKDIRLGGGLKLQVNLYRDARRADDQLPTSGADS